MDNSSHPEEADLISRLLDAGEGLEIEYKRCRDLPHDDTFETICSFANRQGHILLGWRDNGTAEGVNASRVREICRNVANRLNNPNYFNIMRSAMLEGPTA